MDTELKEYFKLHISQLSQTIDRLSGAVSSQSALINDINIKSTTRVAELQKDIDDIRDEVKNVRQDIRSVDESQKFKWQSLSTQRETERKEREEREKEQAEVNQAIRLLTRLLWAVITILLSIGIPFVWSLIVNGGIQGIYP